MTLGALTSTLRTLVLQKRLHRFDIKKNFFNHSRPPKHSPRSAVSPRQCCILPIDTLSSGQGSRIVFCTAKERSKRRLCLGLARLCQRLRMPPPQHEMGTQWFFHPTENMLVIWLSKTSLFFSNASFFFDHSRLISRNFTSLFVPFCSYQNSPILRICPSFNRQTWDHHARWRQQPLLAMGYLTTHKFKNVIQSLANHHKSWSPFLVDDPFQYFWYLLILTYFDPLAWQEPHGRLLLCKVHLLPLGTPDDLISNQSSSSYPQGGVTPIWTKMNWTPQSAKSLLPDRCKRAGRRVWCLISLQLQTAQISRDLPDILGEYVLLFGVVRIFLAQTLSQFAQREVAGSECCRVELGETAKWLWESIPPKLSHLTHSVT